MSAPWLHVVGVTEAGVGALPASARALLDTAEVVIGVPRRLAGIERAGKEFIEWDGALEHMVVRVLASAHRPTVLLATGDPNWFGIGATLSQRLPPEEFAVHPAPSAFQLAAARLHWPLHDVACVSCHGRSVAGLTPHIQPGARILALTSDASTVAAIAARLDVNGFGRSRLTVLNHLGGENETHVAFTAGDPTAEGVTDFNTLAIECVADPDTPLRAVVAGLPDDAFAHDGQVTKREVRAVTLARLAPTPGALLWDVGAGCGSIAIEWMRASPRARAIAVERDETRRKMIETNADTLGTPGLAVVSGDAPAALAGLALPDAVFHGGGVASDAIFETCWSVLAEGGRMVANAVTLDAEAALIARQRLYGGELTRIGIERLDTIGNRDAFRPAMTVTQWAVTKGETP